VRHVSFAVAKGQVVALVGPNGAGKTTLIEALAGQAAFQSGFVMLDGIEPSDERRYKASLAYLPEERGFPPYLSPRIASRLAEKLWLQEGLMARFLDEAKILALDEGSLDLPVRTLSQGNREKLALALVFSREAAVYLLDEPEAHLDPIIRERLEIRIKQLKDEGKAALFSTHDVFLAARLADDVLAIQNGRLARLGAARKGEDILEAIRTMEDEDE